MHCKMGSAKSRPFCFGFHTITPPCFKIDCLCLVSVSNTYSSGFQELIWYWKCINLFAQLWWPTCYTAYIKVKYSRCFSLHENSYCFLWCKQLSRIEFCITLWAVSWNMNACCYPCPQYNSLVGLLIYVLEYWAWMSCSSSNFIPNRIQQYNRVCMTNITNNRVIIDIVMWFCWWPPEKHGLIKLAATMSWNILSKQHQGAHELQYIVSRYMKTNTQPSVRSQNVNTIFMNHFIPHKIKTLFHLFAACVTNSITMCRLN